MHLKALTLRGFKSFASATTLRFEPGIVCVVGPNGSGKSNVVDALAWVMGEQGAKSLRGGKMEDVIFAGTAGRAPLGRAEVSLTIDNADGALPIDYSEVTLTRTMFRNGGSEYAINGSGCRLLDIQELLSDSGIGREMHVIVGQGRLDAILSASPEERRGFIEEAAGVLKHRKRKEKALRKLDAMSANLARVTDLTVELRRQLKPLGRQAEVARRAAVVQADLRDSRLRLFADDLITLRTQLADEAADEAALQTRRASLSEQVTALSQDESELDGLLVASSREMTSTQETWYRLSSLRERLQGTASLAQERARNAVRPSTDRPGRDPEDLEREAQAVLQRETDLAAELTRAQTSLVTVSGVRSRSEQAVTEHEAALARQQRAEADRREGLARLVGQVNAARTRVNALDAEAGRLDDSLTQAWERAAAAERDLAELEAQASGMDAGEEGLDARYEAASAASAQARSTVDALREEARAAERERDTWTARREALALGLARKDGSAALLANPRLRLPDDVAIGAPSGDVPRPALVLASMAHLLAVEPGIEAAVAAGLGRGAEAVAVIGLSGAAAALRWLHESDSGQAAALVLDPAVTAGDLGRALRVALPSHREPAPATSRWLSDCIEAPTALHQPLRALLEDTVLVGDLDQARSILDAQPGLTCVTRSGDVLTAHLAAGGSASAPSLIEVQAAVADAAAALDRAQSRLSSTTERIEVAQRELEQLQALEAEALSRLHDSDASMAVLADQLGRLGAAVRSAEGEATRLRSARAGAEESRRGAQQGLAELEDRLAAAQSTTEPDSCEDRAGDEPSTQRRDELRAELDDARAAETEVRLVLRSAEERVRGLAGRADSLMRQARAERSARAHAVEEAVRRKAEARVATEVLDAATLVLDRLNRSLAAADAERLHARERSAAAERDLSSVRSRRREAESSLASLVDAVHRDELVKAEGRAKVEALESRALEDLGIDSETLVTEYGPEQLVPPSPPAPGEDREVEPQPVPYDRAEQTKRMRAAERDLALLGRVNPLALEEFSALEERHQFLTEQLEDLKATRRSLLEIIREVDERVEEVFAEAFADTAREFETVFARLFPGGEGRLVLTDPSDLLTTGIEVEARPPGKKIKRLSLLSGGERALVAVAILVAIFKARPSPFYILDEVEAALDDTNLSRLLTLYEELRDSSQLIVITHQKRTMEIADALYGVTMRGDGVSTVISQRLRQDAPV